MTTVIDRQDVFASRECPAGSLAIHPDHGLCEVLTANGFTRQLLYRTDGPSEACGCLASADVRVLRSANPLKDIGN